MESIQAPETLSCHILQFEMILVMHHCLLSLFPRQAPDPQSAVGQASTSRMDGVLQRTSSPQRTVGCLVIQGSCGKDAPFFPKDKNVATLNRTPKYILSLTPS